MPSNQPLCLVIFRLWWLPKQWTLAVIAVVRSSHECRMFSFEATVQLYELKLFRCHWNTERLQTVSLLCRAQTPLLSTMYMLS